MSDYVENLIASLVNLNDFELLAKSKLEKSIYNFYSGGAQDEITLNDNVSSYKKIKLHPKILQGVVDPDTKVSLFGQTLELPILVAPMAFQGLCHPEGELATANGVNQCHTTMVISSYSTTPYLNIKNALDLPPWFQLYIFKDRAITKALIETIEALKFHALVVTVDAPIYGKRERELRNPLQNDIKLPDLRSIIQKMNPSLELRNNKQLSSFLNPSITWSDIEWIRSITKLPIIIKGILRVDDAQCAVAHGIDGIVVSNHGGRQLDTTPSTISMLPKIAEKVGDQIEILLDGGIRRGTDIIKALGFGAKAILLGRPIIWGLALKGSQGVKQVLAILQEELKMGMILSGCHKISDIDSSMLTIDQ